MVLVWFFSENPKKTSPGILPGIQDQNWIEIKNLNFKINLFKQPLIY